MTDYSQMQGFDGIQRELARQSALLEQLRTLVAIVLVVEIVAVAVAVAAVYVQR